MISRENFENDFCGGSDSDPEQRNDLTRMMANPENAKDINMLEPGQAYRSTDPEADHLPVDKFPDI